MVEEATRLSSIKAHLGRDLGGHGRKEHASDYGMHKSLDTNTISLSYCVNTLWTSNYELSFSYQFSISWKCLFRSQYWVCMAVESVLSLAVLIVKLPFRLSMCCALYAQPCRGVWGPYKLVLWVSHTRSYTSSVLSGAYERHAAALISTVAVHKLLVLSAA